MPQKRLQTARQPPVYPTSSPDHHPSNSLTPLLLPSRRPSVSIGGFGLSCPPTDVPLLHRTDIPPTDPPDPTSSRVLLLEPATHGSPRIPPGRNRKREFVCQWCLVSTTFAGSVDCSCRCHLLSLTPLLGRTGAVAGNGELRDDGLKVKPKEYQVRLETDSWRVPPTSLIAGTAMIGPTCRHRLPLHVTRLPRQGEFSVSPPGKFLLPVRGLESGRFYSKHTKLFVALPVSDGSGVACYNASGSWSQLALTWAA